MSNSAAFRRVPVDQQFSQNLALTTIPAPTRGIIQHENDAFMGPGACIISDNWVPTMKGVKLRGGTIRWCDLHALDTPVPPVPSPLRKPVVSAFEYVTGNDARMYAAQETKLFDVTSSPPVLVASGRTSGNYAAAQLSNQGAYWLIAVNETGDIPLRFNGTTWTVLDPSAITAWANSHHYVVGATAKDTTDNTYWKNTVDHTSAASGTFAADRTAHPTFWTSASAPDGAGYITGPIGSNVVNGRSLSFVCKYRNRLFFIETKSMNLWYLGINSISGALTEIPLSGNATHGGYLVFLANWTIDAGDGIDDKLIAMTSEGEVLIFSGNDPADPNNWKQEGQYHLSPPLGMNAFDNVGGDVLILTVDGIIPISQAITKSAGELELALVTRAIKRMWRDEVNAKRQYPWTFKKWDEYGGNFVTFPGGTPGNRYALAMNNTTGAFARCLGWDAMCFVRLRGDMFFGNQDGIIMQCERTGYDDGKPYVATLVGGWDMFQAGMQEIVWHQARAIFISPPFEPFEPQITATTDFIVTIPPPPPAGVDPGVEDVWDEGEWDVMKWDATAPVKPANRNTMWLSVGMTGFAHAPIVQITVAQQSKPDVELLAIGATYERAGVNV
jgi:hypothetical protein